MLTGKRAFYVIVVTPARAVQTPGPAQLVRRRQIGRLVAGHAGLDLDLDVVRQLVAVGPEQFYPVVVVGVVRGRQHDAQIGAQRLRQHGDGRRRDRADDDHVHADGDEPGNQRRFQQIARQPRVLPDHHAVAMVAADELRARRHADLQRRFGVHGVGISGAADAVGAE